MFNLIIPLPVFLVFILEVGPCVSGSDCTGPAPTCYDMVGATCTDGVCGYPQAMAAGMPCLGGECDGAGNCVGTTIHISSIFQANVLLQ